MTLAGLLVTTQSFAARLTNQAGVKKKKQTAVQY